MTSPFEAGRAIGSNISSAFEKSRDMTNIQDILAQAAKYNNSPEAQQTAIQRILGQVSESRQPNVMQLLQNQGQLQQQQLQKQRQAEYYQSQGLDPRLASMPEGIQTATVKGSQQAKTSKNLEKIGAIEGALNSVQRMKELIKTGDFGPRVSGPGKTSRSLISNFSKKATQNRAEYERLGKSLISQASTIVVRNKSEFDNLKKDLDNPNASVEELQGVIAGMERILNNNLNALRGSVDTTGESITPNQQMQGQQQYSIGQTATNPQTGEVLKYNGIAWESAK